MHKNETATDFHLLIRDRVITVVVKKYKDTSFLEPEENDTRLLQNWSTNVIQGQ